MEEHPLRTDLEVIEIRDVAGTVIYTIEQPEPVLPPTEPFPADD